VPPGVRGAPAKFKPAANALAENANHARAQTILATDRGFADARVTVHCDNPIWEKFKARM
jgi:hypothetical protein